MHASEVDRYFFHSNLATGTSTLKRLFKPFLKAFCKIKLLHCWKKNLSNRRRRCLNQRDCPQIAVTLSVHIAAATAASPTTATVITVLRTAIATVAATAMITVHHQWPWCRHITAAASVVLLTAAAAH
jgi:hypothetical protein